jgi:hypothetical protein
MKVCGMAASSLLLAVLWAGASAAQTPDLEPGVQTSPSSAPATPPPSLPPQPAPRTMATPSAAPQAGASPHASSTPPAAHGAATPGSGAPADKSVDKSAGKSQDHIQLDTTQISGNRELPKVMYVVPWRKADVGEFAGRPPNSLLDEALTPVDRDVFRRQNRYYSALEAGSATSGAKTAAPEAKDEK